MSHGVEVLAPISGRAAAGLMCQLFTCQELPIF